eukprot:3274321-Ditylum_brightwellii.AAC.1
MMQAMLLWLVVTTTDSGSSKVHILKVHLVKLQCGATTVKEVHNFGVIVQCPDDITKAKAVLKDAQFK